MPVHMVTYEMKRGRSGKAEMLIRMEGCEQNRIHMQRIDVEPA